MANDTRLNKNFEHVGYILQNPAWLSLKCHYTKKNPESSIATKAVSVLNDKKETFQRS
jgi:hypothetical protein